MQVGGDITPVQMRHGGSSGLHVQLTPEAIASSRERLVMLQAAQMVEVSAARQSQIAKEELYLRCKARRSGNLNWLPSRRCVVASEIFGSW